jgi:hypothetical protein
MATVKKGTLTQPPEWWKHLRWAKRRFWKRERQAAKAEIVRQPLIRQGQGNDSF